MDVARKLLIVSLIVVATIGTMFIAVRFVYGIGAVANINNAYPWGWWVGFGVLSFIAFGGTGFTIALLVYILGLERYRPFVRPAVTMGLLLYLGYLVILMIELGRPWVSPIIFVSWQPTSALFEVAWCATLYTIVLMIEFGHMAAKHRDWYSIERLLRFIYLPAVVIGVSLSHLHQSSLGNLLTIVPLKVEPLWWSELLPATFLLTSYMAGLTLVTIEHVLVTSYLGLRPRVDLMAGLARILVWVIALFLALRIGDLVYRDAVGAMLRLDGYSLLVWSELTLGFVVPMTLLAIPDMRMSKWSLFGTSLLLAVGVLMNRLNTAVFGMRVKHWETYFPSVGEFAITVGVLAGMALVYIFLLHRLPIHTEEPLTEADVDPIQAPRAAAAAS